MEKERDGLGEGLREVAVIAKSVNAETACFPTDLLPAFLSSPVVQLSVSSVLERIVQKNVLLKGFIN
jgi:hypothetical protein